MFCRENTLKALYSIGNAGAVIQALNMMNEFGWYHYPRLISDGLMEFQGDRYALARQMWLRSDAWSEPLQVAAVQFATNLTDAFADDFLRSLREGRRPLEVRFALVRYFQRHTHPEAKDVLLQMLEREQLDGGGLAISAAAALANYPCDEVRSALMTALHSRNWYVRRNAAHSLVSMGATEADAERLVAEDPYAADMLRYALESANQPAEPKNEEVAAE